MRLVFQGASATEVVLLIVNEVEMRFLTLDTLQYYGVVQTCRRTGGVPLFRCKSPISLLWEAKKFEVCGTHLPMRHTGVR